LYLSRIVGVDLPAHELINL